jgi:hypothetical protein
LRGIWLILKSSPRRQKIRRLAPQLPPQRAHAGNQRSGHRPHRRPRLPQKIPPRQRAVAPGTAVLVVASRTFPRAPPFWRSLSERSPGHCRFGGLFRNIPPGMVKKPRIARMTRMAVVIPQGIREIRAIRGLKKSPPPRRPGGGKQKIDIRGQNQDSPPRISHSQIMTRPVQVSDTEAERATTKHSRQPIQPDSLP